MHDVFEAWCQDSRSLTYGEFLDELFGEWQTWAREVAPGFLDDRFRELPSNEPQTPAQQTYQAIYAQCRRRLHAGEWFAVCFLDIEGHAEYLRKFAGTIEDIIAVLTTILDQLVLSPSVDGFVARVGKVRFILVFPANKVAEVCSQILDSFDTHFRSPIIKASIGVVTNQNRRYEHFRQIAELAIEMLKYAKVQPGSVFVVDKRTAET